MAKTKKPRSEWFRSNFDRVVCENGDQVLSIYTFTGRPHIACTIRVAYLETAGTEVWRHGRRVGTSGIGWRYDLTAYVGTGWGMIMLHRKEGFSAGTIRADSPVFSTRDDAIRAALHELITSCDEQLLVPSNSSRPYWGKSQGRYFSRPGSEQLAYYLCLPEWEPMWQLLEEVTWHDDWLVEVRAPKKSEFTEQLQLF